MDEKQTDSFIRRWAMKLTNSPFTRFIVWGLAGAMALALILTFVFGVEVCSAVT